MSLEQLEVLMALERWLQLADHARQQLASNGDDQQAHLYLIAALHNQSQYAAALEHGDRQRPLLHLQPQYWRMRAQSALALDDRRMAADALDRASALELQSAENHRLRAQLLWLGDDLPAIKAELDAGLRLSPHSTELLLLLTRFFLRLGRPDRAEAVLAQVLAADANHAEAIALKASLTPQPVQRRQLYHGLLQRDPQDQQALAGWRQSNPRLHLFWWRAAGAIALVGALNSLWWQWPWLGSLLVVSLWLLTLLALLLAGRVRAQLTQILLLPLLLVDPAQSTDWVIQLLGAVVAGSLLAVMAELCLWLFYPLLRRWPWLQRQGLLP